MIKVFQVMASLSEDGRGPSSTIGYFTDRALAESRAKGAGSWGSDGRVYEITVWEPSDWTPEAVAERERQAALEKLTPAERRSLGFG